MFAELAECYVQAMNSDAVPTISTAWERVIDGEIKRVYDQALEDLEFFIQTNIYEKLPLELPEFKTLMK